MGNDGENRLIFVCTGNYYRSRLAEILFNDYALKRGLDWEGDSKGLVDQTRFNGLSPNAIEYLKKKGFDDPERFARPPEALRVEDLETAKLLVIMNRNEHEPMMKQKFGQIPTILTKQNRLRYFNVYDVPVKRSLMTRVSGKNIGTDQPAESSGEHIDFAVQSLVWELLESK